MKDYTNTVKKSNQKFYDIISTTYEELDGKRDRTTTKWLGKVLSKLVNLSPHQRDLKPLLDIGCGSGFILRNAPQECRPLVGVDISLNILIPLRKRGYYVVCADVDHLPFKENAFSLVTCFAVLHHLYDYESFIKELHRVLTPKGIFYSDHDLDAAFQEKFTLLLKTYRFFYNEEHKYISKNKEINHDLYTFTEIHSNGIPVDRIQCLIKSAGFSDLKSSFHWFGLFPFLTSFLQKFRIRFSRGNAPLVSIIAKK